tara:strand:+ start:3505 stop:4296 length:792 start_codon:yes stop_codon:yes gene_type:complete
MGLFGFIRKASHAISHEIKKDVQSVGQTAHKVGNDFVMIPHNVGQTIDQKVLNPVKTFTESSVETVKQFTESTVGTIAHTGEVVVSETEQIAKTAVSETEQFAKKTFTKENEDKAKEIARQSAPIVKKVGETTIAVGAATGQPEIVALGGGLVVGSEVTKDILQGVEIAESSDTKEEKIRKLTETGRKIINETGLEDRLNRTLKAKTGVSLTQIEDIAENIVNNNDVKKVTRVILEDRRLKKQVETLKRKIKRGVSKRRKMKN